MSDKRDELRGSARDPRVRLSSGLSGTRLRLEARRAALPTIGYVVGIAVAVLIVAFLISHISKTFGRSTYEVRFASPTAFGVFEGFDDVRFRGVPAGNITKIERQDDGSVVLAVRIQKEYGPVYQDAKAELRPITALNDVYLDIVDPGTPKAGKAEADKPLPQSSVQTSVNVQDVLNDIDPDARQGLYNLLANLGNGSRDGGDNLRRGFVALAPFIKEAGELANQVAIRKRTTKRLIENSSLLMSELGTREDELRRLVSTGSATLGTLQEGSQDLDQTIREIAPFFTNIDSTVTRLDTISGDLNRGLTSLGPISESLPGALAAIREGSKTFEPGLASLQRAFTIFPRWVRAIDEIVEEAIPLATDLRPQIPPYARAVQDLVNCETGFKAFWQWNTSFTKFGDSTAAIPRGNLAVGVPSLSNKTAVRTPPPSCVVNGRSSDTVGGRPVNEGDFH